MSASKEKEGAKRDAGIERVGAGGQIGQGQAGRPLHKPDRVAGRERVGAGGPVGGSEENHDTPESEALHDVIADEEQRGDVTIAPDPDQKNETDRREKT